jgi:hypothetical protein
MVTAEYMIQVSFRKFRVRTCITRKGISGRVEEAPPYPKGKVSNKGKVVLVPMWNNNNFLPVSYGNK